MFGLQSLFDFRLFFSSFQRCLLRKFLRTIFPRRRNERHVVPVFVRIVLIRIGAVSKRIQFLFIPVQFKELLNRAKQREGKKKRNKIRKRGGQKNGQVASAWQIVSLPLINADLIATTIVTVLLLNVNVIIHDLSSLLIVRSSNDTISHRGDVQLWLRIFEHSTIDNLIGKSKFPCFRGKRVECNWRKNSQGSEMDNVNFKFLKMKNCRNVDRRCIIYRRGRKMRENER